MTFKLFDIERNWWRLFKKCVVRTNLDIYGVFFQYDSGTGFQTAANITHQIIWHINQNNLLQFTRRESYLLAFASLFKESITYDLYICIFILA